MAQSAPPFPHYPNSFSMGHTIERNHEATPSVIDTLSWDQVGGHSLYTRNYTGSPTQGLPSFSFQLRRCDTKQFYNVMGNGSDHSTWTCITYPMQCPVSPYWIYPNPKLVKWNGTDTINGVECDRFDITSGMGRQTFWGTPTTPCRSVTQTVPTDYTQQDYVNFVASVPPATTFDIPDWVLQMKCKPIDTRDKIAAATTVTAAPKWLE